MKLKHLLFTTVITAVLGGCSSPRNLVFADRAWHISEYYGQIIDRDTTYRMTFGEVLIPEDLTIIANNDSVAKYPGMDRFMADILHTAHLDSAEILFYAPCMSSMFVIPKSPSAAVRPSSISSNMDERTCTLWTYDNDPEDWVRRRDEMFTYTYLNKREGQLLIVNFYDYASTPVAQIKVLQTANNRTRKMRVTRPYHNAWLRHNPADIEKDIEFWAHAVDGHRKLAVANYRIGREQLVAGPEGRRMVELGDSAMAAGNAPRALAYYKPVLIYGMDVEPSTRYNGACAAAICGEIDFGLAQLMEIAERNQGWYLSEPLDAALENLKQAEGWADFYSIISTRRSRAGAVSHITPD